nr:SDR family oxidoreductase [Tenacibaculum mesophilum]
MTSFNKIALVTGANRGIGFAIAKGLLQKGHTVIATSRSEISGKEAVSKLSTFGNVEFCQLDVNNLKSIQNCFHFLKSTYGKLDILVNNAGINYDTWQTVEDANLTEVRETLETNFLAPWQLTQNLLPLLKNVTSSSVVNVSSGTGAFSSQTGGIPGYSLSKLALNGLTLQLANRLKPYNVSVNSVCPGWVRTDMGGSSATKSPEEGADTIIWAALFENGDPTGKFFRNREEISF